MLDVMEGWSGVWRPSQNMTPFNQNVSCSVPPKHFNFLNQNLLSSLEKPGASLGFLSHRFLRVGPSGESL